MRQVRQTPLGQFVTQTTCSKCGGDGQMIPSPCQVCRGRGRIESEKTLTVKIPAGVDDGSRIRISGSGEAGARGGPDGDLYVYLSVRRHERYRRDALDLYVDVPISFPQAALGGEIEVPSMDGPIPLSLQAGTQSGSTYRLRGRGCPACAARRAAMNSSPFTSWSRPNSPSASANCSRPSPTKAAITSKNVRSSARQRSVQSRITGFDCVEPVASALRAEPRGGWLRRSVESRGRGGCGVWWGWRGPALSRAVLAWWA